MYIPNGGWAVVVAGKQVIGLWEDPGTGSPYGEEAEECLELELEEGAEEDFEVDYEEDFGERPEAELAEKNPPDNVVRIKDYFGKEE